MPTYNQGAFIRRSLTSLFAQDFKNWELILINDGSTDYTEQVIEDYIDDSRVRYYKNDQNKGLGFCLNLGILYAKHEFICYLPSDDIYYANHLSSLYNTLSKTDASVLSYSGLYYDNTDNYANGLSIKKVLGMIPDQSLQLVQVMHKKKYCQWVEREEFVTGNLNKMFWGQLSKEGTFVGTGTVTCEWVSHPHQRHKIVSEKYGGGIHFYKKHYSIKAPLKFYTESGNYINEKTQSAKNRNISITPGKLKILIVGELGFNPERLTVFEKEGHRLFGLWISNPDIQNAIGPFSFGNIIDLEIENLQTQIEEIKPDIIYALLNTQAVRLAHYVMRSNPNIPIVWHFKEGPFFCRNRGIWKEMVELFYNADGRIYINQQCKEWFDQFIGDKNRLSYILDGDLPPLKWFANERSTLLSNMDGNIHTVIAGRPYGIKPSDIAILAKHNIYLHLYGEFYQSKWKNWVKEVHKLCGEYLQLHTYCKPKDWTKELSKYDAGWLHCFASTNNGELMRCSWNDLNYPARISTLAVAGLPMIQKNNSGHLVASQKLLTELGVGVLFNSYNELGKQLNDEKSMEILRQNVWEKRLQFSFDYYIHDLINFFKQVIKAKHAV
ncbi:MAG TPA: glycosyltransferase family 2 protein [Chitinophagaceae bacterium]|nr:glycosyltransferase family 2 protein [Chitinophagaceae bacterium]